MPRESGRGPWYGAPESLTFKKMDGSLNGIRLALKPIREASGDRTCQPITSSFRAMKRATSGKKGSM
jgi:hypothetical protein